MGARSRSTTRGESEKLPAFFYRLSPASQRAYLRSDSIEKFDFAPTPQMLRSADMLMETLVEGSQAAIGMVARQLADELCRLLRVPPISIEVRGVRPHDARGELHGIFYQTRPPRIVLWMRTAQRHQAVKPRTFIRTLFHELGHYFDYTVLRLGDSFHTRGFFQRESSLVRALLPADEARAVRDSDRSVVDEARR
jgi:hypothetical protein